MGCLSRPWRFDVHVLFLRGGHIEPVGHRDSMQWAIA
jgi:hypothetical protein